MEKVVCESLEEVRANIDRIDQAMLAMIAERATYVTQAARFKRTSDEVRASQRVEQVITRIRTLAVTQGWSREWLKRSGVQ